MDLDITTQKIVSAYIKHGIDLNESIAKVAEDNSCNIEQVKRLVEKSNQETFLAKFAQDGSQVFDIADFDKVKSIIQSSKNLEKKASDMSADKIEYNNSNVYGFGDMEKTASDNISIKDIDDAIQVCTDKINEALTKIASTFTENNRQYNFETLEKIAKDNNSPELEVIDKYEKVRDKLLEKKAGIVTGLAGAGLKAGGNAVGFVAKAPIKRGLIPMTYAQTFNSGAKKAVKETAPIVSNMSDLPKIAEVEKDAGLLNSSLEILEKAAPYMLASGAIMGAAAAGRGVSSLAARMMNTSKLNESFNDIMESNKDLKQIPQARQYFDVIARHSPDLAVDPLVAPQLIRNFDAFGGVDLNTVGKLREIQERGQTKPAAPLFDMSTLGTALKGAKGPVELDNAIMANKENKFKRIQNIADSNPLFRSQSKFKSAYIDDPEAAKKIKK